MSAIGEFFGFSGGDAGQSAARQAQAQNQLGIDELRRQFDISQANLDPFIQAGVGQLPALAQGTTAGGLEERLKAIFSGESFGALRDERTRAVQGHLAAGGFTRSGEAVERIADVPTDLGFDIEQLLTNRSQFLATGGRAGAGTLGGIGAQTGGDIANLFARSGSQISTGALQDARSRTEANQNIIDTVSGILFSDPALKQNVEKVSEINDLNVYQWDWIKGAKGTLIELCPTIGFMADEVEEKYPDFVNDNFGFKTIDLVGLLDELEAA